MLATEYKVEDIIEYRTFGGGLRKVRVTAKYPDIKNGRPGFDAELVDEKLADGTFVVWGYDDQIVRVVKRG